MITRKQATQAKDKLTEQLAMYPWFRGIALGLGGSGISIHVAIDEVTDEAVAVVPKEFEGVEVILEQAIISTPFDPRWLK